MSIAQWVPADGVVEFPNGVRVRGRGLVRACPAGPDPTMGIYPGPGSPPWLRGRASESNGETSADHVTPKQQSGSGL